MAIGGLLILLIALAVIAVVFGLLVLLARTGKGGTIAAVVIGLFLLSIGGLFVGMFTVRSVTYVQAVNEPSVVATAETTATRGSSTAGAVASAGPAPMVSTTPDVWHTAASQGFAADVYPSLEAGSEALARQAADWIATLDPEPAKVQLALRAQSVENQAAVEAARAALRVVMPALQQAPDYEVQSGSFSNDDEWGLTIELEPARRGSGSERLVWKSGDRQWEGSVAVRDLPWVDDPSWSGNAERGTPMVVGYSDGFFADPVEAERSAVGAAARQLRDTTPGEVLNPLRAAPPPDPTRLQQTIRDAIYAEGLVRDQFLQAVDRPYGRVYRAAALVDAGTSAREQVYGRLQEASTAVGVALVEERQRRDWQIGSTVALLVLIVLVYAALNALTKHYFLWRLRAAACLIAIVGLLAILTRI